VEEGAGRVELVCKRMNVCLPGACLSSNRVELNCQRKANNKWNILSRNSRNDVKSLLWLAEIGY
jgi:hypothetical protein